MKRIVSLGLSSVLMAPIISTTVIFAQELNTTTKPSTTATSDEDKATALAERVQKRKTELKTKLTAAQKARLQAKCQASQGLISSISGRIKGIETSRGKVYANTVSRLMDLSTKLQNKEIDTADLDKSIADLETKIETFNTDLAAYKLAVSDLIAIDCKTDPDGFKASLDAARAAQQKVSQDGQAIRAQLKDVIKPLLKSLRALLEPADDETTEGGQ